MLLAAAPIAVTALTALAHGTPPHAAPTHARGAVISAAAAAVAANGDVVRVKYGLAPDMTSKASSYGENAESLCASLPFDVGECKFVLGGGGYLDGLHDAVRGMSVGESAEGVAIDAGAGEYMDEGAAKVPIAQAPEGLKTGMAVMLTVGGGRQVQATVTEMDEETFTLDTNHPLAGVRFLLDVELLAVEEAANFEVATFAGGCFWGLELAYQREVGVVGTAVGYTQGTAESPTYQEVCSGTTGHTEAVQVVFDPSEVSYERLCRLLVERLGDNIYLLNQVGNDKGTQYRHGIYPHSPAQAETAKAVLAEVPEHATLGEVQTEVADAATFYRAEDYHLQYLQKGGQSAKKSAEETIRCYG